MREAKKYIGHPSQLYSVEEKRLIGGKADGMRVFEIRNGLGISFTVSADRCADIPKMYFKDVNLAYIAPCGLVAPSFYDKEENGFLKSFTAGFLTTCGLNAAGAACEDEGVKLGLHGTISHTPAERIYYTIEDDCIIIHAAVRDASLFGAKMLMVREIRCSLKENKIIITDKVTNEGTKREPFMLLYHFNMGYPLLDENSVLTLPKAVVTPRDAHAAEDLDKHMLITAPQESFTEQCYYHHFTSDPLIELYNPVINKGIQMQFSIHELDCFTQWKMLGNGEYVLGLEPANCYPDGRDTMRRQGKLKFLDAGQTHTDHIEINFIEKV